MTVKNPFEAPGEATRYQNYRPRYHDLPMAMIRNFIGRDLEFALDIACGTGHSTEALSKVSKRTIGCDQSESMLEEARKSSKLEFVKADAEQLPYPDQTFDLVNVSMGFHWLRQKEFLREAHRVLQREGFLCVDNYGFSGQISSDPEKQSTHQHLFHRYLPPVSRSSGFPTADLLSQSSFEMIKELSYEHEVPFTENQFINLLMTWSNFQILDGDAKLEAAAKMTEVYGKIFGGQTLALPFAGKACVYCPIAARVLA